jgi:glutamyl/glutaminyl-tRNA synthetase
MSVKVRIAPSPTGNLHIGTARTALFNWLFARHHGGQFIVRIEDTDVERSKKEYEQNIVDGLRWLGLDWDNPKLIRQSERLPMYRARLEKMLSEGTAAWREYTEEERASMIAIGKAVRDKVIILVDRNDPEREIGFDDIIRGHVSVRSKHIGQIVLAKDLDTPLYNFAVVVDDIDMEISHVIRGEDHISNTPKQLLIYEALGLPPPQFAHLPLILGEDRSKMSKRHGATNIEDYQADYLPDALLSFMGQLGYTYDRELLDKHEMATQFDLAKVHSSGAVFDIKKLNWTNTQYIKKMSPQDFKAVIGMPELPDSAVSIMTERLERLTDIAQFSYLWKRPEYDGSLLLWKEDDAPRARRALEQCRTLVENGDLTKEALDALAASDFDAKKGSVYWPLRTALSGLQNSAGPLDIAGVIGREETLARIESAISKLA